jgi:precorrin-6x reductase
MNVLLFAGTMEGRQIAEALDRAKVNATVSVVTDYGAGLLNHLTHVKVLTGGLDESQMKALIKTSGFTHVIDATHPYATEVTQNILASKPDGAVYYRVVRNFNPSHDESAVYVSDIAQVVEILNASDKPVLVTTGMKDIESFTRVNDYNRRVFLRILPQADSIEKASELGYALKNLICMQGPFDKDFNKAMLLLTGAGFLVT